MGNVARALIEKSCVVSEPSTTVRTLHSLGLYAWFGASLFG